MGKRVPWKVDRWDGWMVIRALPPRHHRSHSTGAQESWSLPGSGKRSPGRSYDAGDLRITTLDKQCADLRYPYSPDPTRTRTWVAHGSGSSIELPLLTTRARRTVLSASGFNSVERPVPELRKNRAGYLIP